MKEHVRRNVAWPVSPGDYPLCGPSRGQVYCPQMPPPPPSLGFRILRVLGIAALCFVAFVVVDWFWLRDLY